MNITKKEFMCVAYDDITAFIEQQYPNIDLDELDMNMQEYPEYSIVLRVVGFNRQDPTENETYLETISGYPVDFLCTLDVLCTDGYLEPGYYVVEN